MTDRATPAAPQRGGRTLLRVGAVGATLTALCCFTPVLVIVLSGMGMAAAIAYLDLLLLPMLAGFLVITVLGWLRLRRARVH